MKAKVRRRNDATLMVLRLEEGATSHTKWAASGSWRGEGNGFSLEPPEERSLADILTVAR